MPTIDGIRVDAVRLVPATEWDPRTRKITTLQVHHATTKSLSGLESLMAPGGRTVSANMALGNDGTKVLKVPVGGRAYTSATAFDHESFTVECCNTSLAPDWGISQASHEALAELLLDLHDHYGVELKLGIGGVIGHRNVPGTYATACPGPSMDLARIVRRAKELKEEREIVTLDAKQFAELKNLIAGNGLSKPLWDHTQKKPGDTEKNSNGGQLLERSRADIGALLTEVQALHDKLDAALNEQPPAA